MLISSSKLLMAKYWIATTMASQIFETSHWESAKMRTMTECQMIAALVQRIPAATTWSMELTWQSSSLDGLDQVKAI
jgi:accessory gene regulator protein AgrB